MSMLGKILAVLNLIAAGAFIFLVRADYTERQAWAYRAYRYNLAINGLPLDAKEKDPIDDFPLVDLMHDELPARLGITGIKTQDEALKKAKQRVFAEIDGKDGDDAKRKLAAEYLAAVCDNFEERRLALEKGQSPDAPLDEIKNQLEKKFAACNSTPGEKSQPLSPPARKRAIAHILFNLVPDTASDEDVWKERVKTLTIVGAKAFITAAENEAFTLRRQIATVQELMELELNQFAKAHDELVRHIYDETIHLKLREQYLLKQQELERRHKRITGERDDEVKALLAKIANARAATAKALEVQEKEETKLFELQKQINKASDDNEKMETKIRQLETSGR